MHRQVWTEVQVWGEGHNGVSPGKAPSPRHSVSSEDLPWLSHGGLSRTGWGQGHRWLRVSPVGTWTHTNDTLGAETEGMSVHICGRSLTKHF